MKTLQIVIASAMMLVLAGCASIAGDNTRLVKVNSYPAGAGIYVDNQQYGVTPATISLPTYIYGGKTVTLKKRGFQTQTQVVNTAFQPVALFNVLFWPGFIIDGATGNLVKIDPANRNLSYNLAHG